MSKTCRSGAIPRMSTAMGTSRSMLTLSGFIGKPRTLPAQRLLGDRDECGSWGFVRRSLDGEAHSQEWLCHERRRQKNGSKDPPLQKAKDKDGGLKAAANMNSAPHHALFAGD